MTIFRQTLALLAMLVLAGIVFLLIQAIYFPAHAGELHRHGHYHARLESQPSPFVAALGFGLAQMLHASIVAHPAGCPARAFCGCGVSVRAFGHPVRDLYLAANWYRFPRAPAAAGTVAIFGRHHVAYIESVNSDGTATLYDPNSGGGATRVHTRSIAGATIVRPSGG
jgi:hypothetical protein